MNPPLYILLFLRKLDPYDKILIKFILRNETYGQMNKYIIRAIIQRRRYNSLELEAILPVPIERFVKDLKDFLVKV